MSKVFQSADGRSVEGIGLAVAISELKSRVDTLARSGDSLFAGLLEGTCMLDNVL